jgi:alpha-D-ribose 1-methylphosphonate 5-phosphate C-P lyase
VPHFGTGENLPMDTPQLPRGQAVRLSSAQGEVDRVVVEDRGDVVFVCREDEYEAAQKEGRQPIMVGFKRHDIVAVGAAAP